MKIVHILKGKANPNTMNGVNKVVHHLATQQNAAGLDTEVWGITRSKKPAEHEHDYRLRLFSTSRLGLRLSSELKSAINSLPTGTLVHFHSVFVPEFYPISRLLRRNGIDWVLSPHGGYAPQSLEKSRLAKSIYTRLFERKIIDGAVRIHVIGLYNEADCFSGTLNASKICIVPNGVEAGDVFKTEYDQSQTLNLVYCGRLTIAQKGLDLLLNAIAKARSDGLDVRLSLIGDGTDYNNLKAMATRLGISEAVAFHGMRTGKEKDSLIVSGDVFVHTSRWEGMPTSVLEAATMGMPLLITKETNLESIIHTTDGGIVVKLSIDDIVNGMHKLAIAKKNQELTGMGERVRQAALLNHSWRSISCKIVESIYKGVHA